MADATYNMKNLLFSCLPLEPPQNLPLKSISFKEAHEFEAQTGEANSSTVTVCSL